MTNSHSEILHCSPETKRLIVEKCLKNFLEFHPEMEGMKITQNHILVIIGKFYLNIPFSQVIEDFKQHNSSK